MRKLILVAVAVLAAIAPPAAVRHLTATPDSSRATMATAVQPAPADPNGQHNWPLLERCWTATPTPVAALPDGCAGVTLRLWCDWRADYPSRLWVSRACGPIESWPAHFGASWWGGDTDPDHPARLWVARLRAGGQP